MLAQHFHQILRGSDVFGEIDAGQLDLGLVDIRHKTAQRVQKRLERKKRRNCGKEHTCNGRGGIHFVADQNGEVVDLQILENDTAGGLRSGGNDDDRLEFIALQNIFRGGIGEKMQRNQRNQVENRDEKTIVHRYEETLQLEVKILEEEN